MSQGFNAKWGFINKFKSVILCSEVIEIKLRILNESTTFRNQIMRVLFIIYTALHVSAHKQHFNC
jgi:hypothetical protein